MAEHVPRALPNETESEAWVIGSILTEPDRMDEVAVLLRPSDFYREDHEIIFQAMSELYAAEKKIDHVTLSAKLRQHGRLNQLTDGNPLAPLMRIAAEFRLPAHAAHHAHRVREASVKRGIIQACEAGAAEGFTSDVPAAELLANVEARILGVQEDRVSNSLHHVNEAAQASMSELQRRMEGEAEPAGVPTGFADLDRLLVTLRPGELSILAARPGMGKSALAANVAIHAALDVRTATLFVSLEMSKLELADRCLSGRANVRLSAMRQGNILPEERRRLVEAAAEMGQGPFWIDDSPSRNVLEISATARRLMRKNKLGLVIIDYLQLIDPEDRKVPREQQVALISKRLKRLARELEIPVLCLAQLNRMNEAQPNKRPKLSHLRESGAIEQDADVVLFLFREEYYLSPIEAAKQGVAGHAEAIVAKQRNGRTGTAKLLWQEDYTKFSNLSTSWQTNEGDEWNPKD